MYRHVKNLQFAAKPEKPDAVYAMKLQELIGGQFGDLTVTMQYLFQGWSCRMPGKYKDMLLDIGTEEIGHVEMISTMIARLLEGAPSETTEKAAAANPALAAVLGDLGSTSHPLESWATRTGWVRQFSRDTVLPRFEQILQSVAQGTTLLASKESQIA